MKLSVFLLLVICFQSSAESYSQNVTLSERNAPLEKVFKSIKKQTDYVFFFDYSWLDQAKPVNINVKNLPLEQALNLCFKNQPLTYAVVGKTVVIKPKIMSVQDSVSKVSGTVTDAQGAPLIGVSVKIREKADAGVTTDHNGKYSVSVLDQQTLIFSYIGFKTQSVAINGRIVINVVLKEDLAELNEVVVIGYGSTTKKDLTGSVGQVQMADIAKAPVFTFTDALAGRVAGVQVSSNDGQPGSQQNIVIRGSGSLTQNTDPLYVIDGFAIESFDSNSLNPSDIESITILKDASSTAVYGSRGSNGVIVVQTKKGKIGKPVVTFNTSLGIQELRKQMELLSPYEFVKTQTEMANPAIAAEVYFKNGKTLDSYKNVEGINWQDLIFRQGVMQNYNMAVRGGSEQTKYSISGTLNDQDAVMINSGYNRYVGRVSLDQNISEKIKIGMNANYSNASSYGVAAATNTGTSSVSNYLFANVYGYRPIDADGNLGLIEDLLDPDMPVGVNTVRINPVITAENTHRISRTTDLTANGYFEYAFNKDLTLNVRAGSRRRIIRSEAFYNSLTPRGAVTPANPNGANGNIAFAENNTWNNDNTLTYNKTFNKDHKLTVLGGFSLEGV
ncbi:MAG: SusC/RagA family TonB-linked outer membrane protein, partial [Sphingobacteriaceae bacterium]